MRPETFKKHLKRFDRNLILNFGHEPKAARQCLLARKEGLPFDLTRLEDRFWTIWRWDPVTGNISPVLTLKDEHGKPREPFESDLRTLKAGDWEARYRREGEPVSKASERLEAELDELDAKDKEKRREERLDYMHRELDDRMRHAMDRDGFDRPVRSPYHLPKKEGGSDEPSSGPEASNN